MKKKELLHLNLIWNDVESAGLVKFDFLGLKTLTILDRAVKRVNEKKNPDEVKVDIENLPLDDPKTFAAITTSRYHGSFSA